MRWLALQLCFVAAAAVTGFVREPFTLGWTNGTQYFVSGAFLPSLVFTSSETPQYALRLQNDAPITQPSRPFAAKFFLNNSVIEYVKPQPMAYGLDVTFSQAQWMGGAYAGDG